MRPFLLFLFLVVSLQFTAMAADTACVSRAIAQAPEAAHAEVKSALEQDQPSVIDDIRPGCEHGAGHRDCSGCHLVGADFSQMADPIGSPANGAHPQVARKSLIPSDIQEQIERPKW